MSSGKTVTVDPQKAILALNAQIVALKKLKAQIPLLVLGPAMNEAIASIQQMAADLSLPSTILLRPPGLAPPGTVVDIPGVTPPATPTPTPTPTPHTLIVGDRVRLISEGYYGNITKITTAGAYLVLTDNAGAIVTTLSNLIYVPPGTLGSV